MNKSYYFKEPKELKYPIIISCPHDGIEFPQDLKKYYKGKFVQCPEDTDWHLSKVYQSYDEIGVCFIHSKYSRYVVDLNRAPEDKSLYNDGRIESTLFPKKSFAGEDLYIDDYKICDEEKTKRLDNYYHPYHNKILKTLNELKECFGVAFLFEGHSIRRKVPLLSKEAFADFILGNQKGRTCPDNYLEIMVNALESSIANCSLNKNKPFMGGHLTRKFGEPENKIYSLQLEMCQDLYMNEDNFEFESEKAAKISYAIAGGINAIGESLIEKFKV